MSDWTSFPWPPLDGAPDRPRWDGRAFAVGRDSVRILKYHEASGNWSHDLTLLHEREAGSRHPLDVISRRLALRLIRKYERAADPFILDVGSSSGFFVEEVRRTLPRARIICSDYLAEPLERVARAQPDVPLIQFDACRCPLPAACLDVVTALNVLEHIEDDQAALNQMARVLKPGGLAYVEVPAHPILYGIYDKYLLHNRRYRMRDILDKSRRAGFELLEKTHLGFAIFPPFFMVKLLDRVHEHYSRARLERRVEKQIRVSRQNPLVRWLLEIEYRLGARVRYPTGIRCVLLLRKSAAP